MVTNQFEMVMEYGIIKALHNINGPVTNRVSITDRNAFWGHFSLKSLAKDVFTLKSDCTRQLLFLNTAWRITQTVQFVFDSIFCERSLIFCRWNYFLNFGVALFILEKYPGRVCRVKGNGWCSGQYRGYYYRCTNRRSTVGTIYINRSSG